MAKMSPEDLDNIFQKGSEQYDFEYNEAAWDHMEGLLEKDDRRRFFWWFFGGRGVILFFGTVYLLFSNEDFSNPKEQTQKQEEIFSTKEISDSIVNHVEKESNTTNLKSIRKENKEVSSKKTNNRNEQTNVKSNTNEHSDASAEVKKKRGSGVTPHISSNNKILLEESNSDFNEIEKTELADSKISTPSLNTESTNPHVKNTSSSLIAPLAMLNFKTIKFDLPEVPILLLSIQPVFDFEEWKNKEAKSRVKKNPSEPKNHFLVGAMIGQEMSITAMDNICIPNIKFGLHVEYRFAQKHGISIGANYIKKEYGAGEGAYSAPPGFWTDAVVPQSTLAFCDILEIPIAYSHFFNDHNNNGFFGTLGLTSYLMLKEQYKYFYDDPPISNPREKWGTTNANKHWLGIGHLSFGFQRVLNKKLSFQIAPYLQLPISQIGHGKIRVWSFGISGKFDFHIINDRG